MTYDDGPNPPYTDRILDVLRREHVHATFFVVGRAVAAYPRTVVREDIERGQRRRQSHVETTRISCSTINRRLRDTLRAYRRCDLPRDRAHSHIMRPPFGGRDWLVLDEVRKLGYTPVMWSVPLANDWEYPPPTVIAARVLRYVGDGSIIDLHDGNAGLLCAPTHLAPHVCDRSADVEATRLIVEELKRQGYRFVTIPELLRLGRGRSRVQSSRAGE